MRAAQSRRPWLSPFFQHTEGGKTVRPGGMNVLPDENLSNWAHILLYSSYSFQIIAVLPSTRAGGCIRLVQRGTLIRMRKNMKLAVLLLALCLAPALAKKGDGTCHYVPGDPGNKECTDDTGAILAGSFCDPSVPPSVGPDEAVVLGDGTCKTVSCLTLEQGDRDLRSPSSPHPRPLPRSAP